MNKSSVFIKVILGSFIGTILLLFAYNYYSNYWGVFSDDKVDFYQHAHVNTSYLKTKYILENPEKYSCFIFGSSRVGSISSRRLGSDCYNFTYSAGIPQNHLHVIRTLLAHKVEVKRVYIALDDFSFTWNPYEHEKEYLRSSYPDSFIEKFNKSLFYLFYIPEFDDLMAWLRGMIPLISYPQSVVDPDYYRDDYRSGELEQYQKYVSDPQFHKEYSQGFQLIQPTLWGKGEYKEESLSAMRGIADVAKANNIALTVFFNPIHYKTYLASNLDLWFSYKRELVEISSFFDFSGINQFSTDPIYWVETSHYKTILGDKVVDSLLQKETFGEGFGEFVTRKTINDFLEDEVSRAVALFPEILDTSDHILLQSPFGERLLEGAYVVKDGILRNKKYMPHKAIDITRDEVNRRYFRVDSRQVKSGITTKGINLDADQRYIVTLMLESDKNGWITLFYGDFSGRFQNERKVQARFFEGNNQIFLPFRPKTDGKRLRIIFGNNPGQYSVSDITLYVLENDGEIPAVEIE